MGHQPHGAVPSGVRTVYVGIDPSGALLAFAILRGDAPVEYRALPLPPHARDPGRMSYAALRAARRVLRPLVRAGYEVHVFIESPISASRGGVKALMPQAKVSGAAQAGAHEVGVTTMMQADQSRWKAVIVGKGTADKAMIAAWVKDNHPHAYEQADGLQDLLDAFCIALYGRSIIARAGRLTEGQDDGQDQEAHG